MFPQFYAGALGTALQSTALLEAPLSGTLHDAMTFTRADGAGSYQTAAAVHGTTFLTRFSSGQVNVPRFHYLAAAGRRMLMVEPARTNRMLDSGITDAGPNDIPDGWTAGGGVAGTDYNTVTTGGPDNGGYFRLEDTAVANRGVYHAGLGLAAATVYTYSALVRRTGTVGAGSIYCYDYGGGGTLSVALTAANFDWTRVVATGTTTGVSQNGYMYSNGDPTGVVWLSLPMIEAGAYASTIIATGGAALTRQAELCAIDSSVINADKGTVRFKWCPLWANTDVTGTATLFAWDASSRIEYEGTTDTIRVVNDGNNRAASAALTFARESLHQIRVDYGSFGTKLYVDGVLTTDANAWVAPTLDAYLGSDAASANCESAGYGDLELAA